MTTEVAGLIETKSKQTDPALTASDHLMLRRLLMAQYGEALGLIDVG